MSTTTIGKSHTLPVPEGIARLTRIAIRRLDQGQGPHTVLAFLASPNTGRMFGSEAASIVARLVGGAR